MSSATEMRPFQRTLRVTGSTVAAFPVLHGGVLPSLADTSMRRFPSPLTRAVSPAGEEGGRLALRHDGGPREAVAGAKAVPVENRPIGPGAPRCRSTRPRAHAVTVPIGAGRAEPAARPAFPGRSGPGPVRMRVRVLPVRRARRAPDLPSTPDAGCGERGLRPARRSGTSPFPSGRLVALGVNRTPPRSGSRRLRGRAPGIRRRSARPEWRPGARTPVPRTGGARVVARRIGWPPAPPMSSRARASRPAKSPASSPAASGPSSPMVRVRETVRFRSASSSPMADATPRASRHDDPRDPERARELAGVERTALRRTPPPGRRHRLSVRRVSACGSRRRAG